MNWLNRLAPSFAAASASGGMSGVGPAPDALAVAPVAGAGSVGSEGSCATSRIVPRSNPAGAFWDAAGFCSIPPVTTIDLREPLTDATLRRVVEEVLAASPGEITLEIDSPGGPTSTSLALRVLLRTASAPIRTVCTGIAVGGAALILASGAAGRRCMARHARLSLGRPAERDSKVLTTDDVVLDDPMFFHELAAATGADRAALERLGDGRWLNAHEAMELGFADVITE